MKSVRLLLIAALAVCFLSPPCSADVNISQIQVTPSGTPEVGVPLTITVNASSSDGQTIYYKFFYCANYGTEDYATTPWTVVQGYSTANTAEYTFNQEGSYIIVARAVTDPGNEPAALPIIGTVVTVVSKTETSSPSLFMGTWVGTFGGLDSGTWIALVDQNGVLSGQGYSNDLGSSFGISGRFDALGNFYAVAGDSSEGATFTGTADLSTRTISGTWVNNYYEEEYGYFSGSLR